MYEIWTLDHDGWNRMGWSFDEFDKAFMKALELAATAFEPAYTRQTRIKYADVVLLEIHREGAKKLWNAICPKKDDPRKVDRTVL